MRVLISAFACEPNMGSEPEAGLQAVLAASSEHEVWVITRENHLPRLNALVDSHPHRDRIHTTGFDIEGLARKIEKGSGLFGIHWHHDAWQRRLRQVAVQLDAEVDFDIVHHATYAAYWTRTGLAAVDKPLVWGPVGGGVRAPLGLLSTMGFKGAVGDIVRSLSRPIIARLVGSHRTARQAAIVIVQNPETARTLKLGDNAMILPNALAAVESVPHSRNRDAGDSPRLVTAGKLVGWKGTKLAIRAMEHLDHTDAILNIYGEGSQRPSLERYAKKLGVSDRITFMGEVPRDDLLEAMSEAAVMIHPSLHEEAGFSVSEALALGTPVVSLDVGGPPVLGRAWQDVPSRAIRPTTPQRTATAMAAAIDDLIGSRGEPGIDPVPSYAEGLLAAYKQASGEKST